MILFTFPFFLPLIALCVFLSVIVKNGLLIHRILPAFFFPLLAVESFCFYLKRINVNNLGIYNIWFPVEFIVYSCWVLSYTISRKAVRIFTILIPAYFLLVAGLYVSTGNLHRFNTTAFQFGFLLLLPLVLLKLYELLNAAVVENPVQNPLFWLLLGLLISYSFSLCEFSMENYLHIHDKSLLAALQSLNIILTDIFYACVIIYFLLIWKQKRLNT